jgi:hypothetical protein
MPAYTFGLFLLCALAVQASAFGADSNERERRPDSAAKAVPSRSVGEGQARGAPGATKPSGDLFHSRSWTPPAPAAADAKLAPAEPVAPAFPFRYIGRMEVAGKITVHLMKGSRLYSVAVGDPLEGEYRVDEIGPDRLDLTYLPLNRKQVVTFSSIAVPAEPPANVAVVSTPGAPPTPVPPVTRLSSPGSVGPSAPGTVAHGGVGMGPQMSLQEPVALGGVSPRPAAAGGASAPQRVGSMIISAPTEAVMPMSAPTMRTMPISPPSGRDMPISPPSGTPMPISPPAGKM